MSSSQSSPPTQSSPPSGSPPTDSSPNLPTNPPPSKATSAENSPPNRPPSASHPTFISTHPSIKYNPSTNSLTITVDFTAHLAAWYRGEEYAVYRKEILSALSETFTSHENQGLKRVLVIITFPSASEKEWTNSLWLNARELLSRIAEIITKNISQFRFQGQTQTQIPEVEVVLKIERGRAEWKQIQCVVGFWGLYGKMKELGVVLIEGEGGEWGKRKGKGKGKRRRLRGVDEWSQKLSEEWRKVKGVRSL